MAVYKDNNGTWYISVRYVNWKGEHARKVKRGFATKREATEWERNFLHENAGNLDMSFETFVDLYKKNLKERLKLSTCLYHPTRSLQEQNTIQTPTSQ